MNIYIGLFILGILIGLVIDFWRKSKLIYRIQRFQLNQLICQRFNCTKTDYSLRRFDDGYLVSIKDKEYRIKLSNTRKPKITFVKAIQRIKEVQK